LEGGWGDVLGDAYIPLPPSKGELKKNAPSKGDSGGILKSLVALCEILGEP